MSQEDRIDWSVANQDIVFHDYGSVAVHTNPQDDIVIRQEDQYGDADVCICIPRRLVPLVALRLLTEAGIVTDKPLRPQIMKLVVGEGLESCGGVFAELDVALTEQGPIIPQGPLSAREVAIMNARPDIDWHEAIGDFVRKFGESAFDIPGDEDSNKAHPSQKQDVLFPEQVC